jgi:hypothetical protein
MGKAPMFGIDPGIIAGGTIILVALVGLAETYLPQRKN